MSKTETPTIKLTIEIPQDEFVRFVNYLDNFGGDEYEIKVKTGGKK